MKSRHSVLFENMQSMTIPTTMATMVKRTTDPAMQVMRVKKIFVVVALLPKVMNSVVEAESAQTPSSDIRLRPAHMSYKLLMTCNELAHHRCPEMGHR